MATLSMHLFEQHFNGGDNQVFKMIRLAFEATGVTSNQVKVVDIIDFIGGNSLHAMTVFVPQAAKLLQSPTVHEVKTVQFQAPVVGEFQ